MTAWTYYNIDGVRVPSEDAVFKGKEVRVASDAAGSLVVGGLGAYEYHDVHRIDEPSLRKTFQSFATMTAWFKERADKAKAKAR